MFRSIILIFTFCRICQIQCFFIHYCCYSQRVDIFELRFCIKLQFQYISMSTLWNIAAIACIKHWIWQILQKREEKWVYSPKRWWVRPVSWFEICLPNHRQPDSSWNVNVQIATVWRVGRLNPIFSEEQKNKVLTVIFDLWSIMCTNGYILIYLSKGNPI